MCNLVFFVFCFFWFLVFFVSCLLWACGSIRKQCKKLWQNAGITEGSLGGLGHKLGDFVCLWNLSNTVLNKCKNIGSQWMCRTDFGIVIRGLNPWISGLAHVQTLWKIPLQRSDASLWSECFLQQVHFFYKIIEPGRASHWSRSCLSLLLCQKSSLLRMQCRFHNIYFLIKNAWYV